MCETICQHFKTENTFITPYKKRGYAHSRSRFLLFQFHSNSPILLVRSKARHSFCSIPRTKLSKLKSLTAKNDKVGSVSQLR